MKLYNSMYLGLCINNQDPERRGRVQVFVPHIMPALYKDWNESGTDIAINCIGDNIEGALSPSVLERLIQILPWAEAASPIIGTSAPGNLVSGGGRSIGESIGGAIGGAVFGAPGQAAGAAVGGAIGDFFDQSPTTSSESTGTPPPPVTGGPVKFNTVVTSSDNPRRGANTLPGGTNGNWAGSIYKLSDVLPKNFTVSSVKRTKRAASDHEWSQLNAYAIDIGINSHYGAGGVLARVQSQVDADALAIYNNIQSQTGGTAFNGPMTATSWDQVVRIAGNGGRKIANNGYRYQLKWRDDSAHFDHIHFGVKWTGGTPPTTAPSAAPNPVPPQTQSDALVNQNNEPKSGIQTSASAGDITTEVNHAATYGLAGSHTQGQSSGVRLASTSKFAFNNDGNRTADTNVSGTYLPKTASGIPNDGEILGYTIPLDPSLRKIARDASGNPVAKIRQPAIVTFTDGTGKKYRVLAVGNDTGGRVVDGNRSQRDWGEFGTNTYRALQSQGMDIGLQRNALSMPSDTSATYEFLDGQIDNIEEYRALKEKLLAEGKLDPYTSPEPTTGEFASPIGTATGSTEPPAIVEKTYGHGPVASKNTNDMPAGLFAYPSPGAMLWVFFREGNPLFPVYFAASYGQSEWAAAYRQGSPTPRMAFNGEGPNGGFSHGTVINPIKGGPSLEFGTDYDGANPGGDNSAFGIFNQNKSNLLIDNVLYQIYANSDRLDYTQDDSFETVMGYKESFIQGNSNQVVMGDCIVKIGNFSKQAVDAMESMSKFSQELNQTLMQNTGGETKTPTIQTDTNLTGLNEEAANKAAAEKEATEKKAAQQRVLDELNKPASKLDTEDLRAIKEQQAREDQKRLDLASSQPTPTYNTGTVKKSPIIGRIDPSTAEGQERLRQQQSAENIRRANEANARAAQRERDERSLRRLRGEL